MRWDKVNIDSYYQARQFEYMAKRYETFSELEKAVECWKRFSEIKLNKGSYFLAYFGKMQVSRIYCKAGDVQMSNAALSEAKEIERDNFKQFHDRFFSALELEINGNIRESIFVYEDIGDHFKDIGNFFLAADAYEHAAENRHKIGMPVRNYELPLDAWSKNSRFWMEKGEDDDSRWSEERKRFYHMLYKE